MFSRGGQQKIVVLICALLLIFSGSFTSEAGAEIGVNLDFSDCYNDADIGVNLDFSHHYRDIELPEVPEFNSWNSSAYDPSYIDVSSLNELPDYNDISPELNFDIGIVADLNNYGGFAPPSLQDREIDFEYKGLLADMDKKIESGVMALGYDKKTAEEAINFSRLCGIHNLLREEGAGKKFSDKVQKFLVNSIKNLPPDILDTKENQLVAEMIYYNLRKNRAKTFGFMNRIRTQCNEAALDDFYFYNKLKNLSREIVGEINSRLGEDNSVRFAAVEDADSWMLYTLITNGDDLFYDRTSSFNGLFYRMLSAMNKEKLSGNQLLKNANHEGLRTFVRLSADFGRLDEFLKTMNQPAQEELLRSFISDIEYNGDECKESMTVAKIINNSKSKANIRFFEDTIKSEYERLTKAGSHKHAVHYAIFASMLYDKAKVEDPWFKQMNQKYKLPNLSYVSSKKIFNGQGINVQCHFFPDTDDGRGSYGNFLSLFKGENNWIITPHKTYVHIESKGSDNKIEIFANEPQYKLEGRQEIKQILKKRKLNPQIVIARGESGDEEGFAVRTISPSTAVVIFGTCGGCYDRDRVLDKNKDVHFIASTGTGIKHVTDPLIDQMNKAILDEGYIYWPSVWKNAEKSISSDYKPYFEKYVSPNENFGAIFMRAYREACNELKK